ncbi:MAG TPA: hypothetical protein VEC14_04980 [Reyranellaceae bacterium]|nr:hypothetical protein [Reyranellaceae bacterium]
MIAAMVRGLPAEKRILEAIKSAPVEEMRNGGMGSLKFVDRETQERRFGTQICEATFSDSDGVPVSITLNLDQHGHLFELDVFKADGSALQRFPMPHQADLSGLKIRRNLMQ